jgi:hypothetical protein
VPEQGSPGIGTASSAASRTAHSAMIPVAILIVIIALEVAWLANG